MTTKAPTAPAMTSSGTSYAWLLVAMLWLVSFFNYADRSVLAAVMPQVREEYALGPAELGLLSSAFLWVYAFAATFAGWLGDRYSRKAVICTGLVIWSLVTMATPLAGSFVAFLLLRALTGLGEASYYPAGTALISDYHGKRTRSRALAIHQTAVFVGGGIGTVAAGALADHFAWRAPFYLYGAAGIVLAIVLVLVMREPPRRVREEASAGETSYGAVLRNRSAIMLYVVFFCANAVTQGVTIWAPTFFHDELNFSLTQATLYGAAPLAVAGFIAVLCSGALGDSIARRMRTGRFVILAVGLLLAAVFLLPFGFMRDPTLLGLCLLLSGFAKGLFDGSIYAAMHDVVAPSARATAVGMMTTLGFIGGGLAPLVVAELSKPFGLGMAITLMAALYLLGTLILVACHRLIGADIARAEKYDIVAA